MQVKKLVPTLFNKSNYIVHYRNLKYYLKHGLIVKRINRAISFKQSTWMGNYIKFCGNMRRSANSENEKNYWKLMMNAVFGKSMENVRERVRIEVVRDPKKAIKLINHNCFKRYMLFNDNLAAIELYKTRTCLDKPIYVGQAILDLSKLFMYEFHYDKMLIKYPRSNLLFTDTDSFCYEIFTEDFYNELKGDDEWFSNFDTSNYPENHLCFSLNRKKEIGKYKDETKGDPVKEFVGLRSKLYSMLTTTGEWKKAMKGVKKCSLKMKFDEDKGEDVVDEEDSKLKHEHYLKCLLTRESINVQSFNIRSEKHKLKTIKEKKVALNYNDDKRYVEADGVNTKAHGHFLILSSYL